MHGPSASRVGCISKLLALRIALQHANDCVVLRKQTDPSRLALCYIAVRQ